MKNNSFILNNKVKIFRFGIIGILAIIWIVFIDSQKLIDWVRYRAKTNHILKEKAFYSSKIKKDSLRLKELNTDSKNLEKYAREKYLMKKPDEEIFLIKETKH